MNTAWSYSRPGDGVPSLGGRLNHEIMERIDRLAKLNTRRVIALSARDRGELLQVAAEYAAMKYMINTARQVREEAG